MVFQLRALLNHFRDFLTSFCLMEFGQFENDRKYCFKMFDPFITTFEVYYWKRLGKESSKGTADERRALNEEVKVYFASRLPAIKVELEKYTTDKWFESFTAAVHRRLDC